MRRIDENGEKEASVPADAKRSKSMTRKSMTRDGTADPFGLTSTLESKSDCNQNPHPESPVNGDDTDEYIPAPPCLPHVETEETYPEGGRRAWLVVLGSWLALFASLGLMNILATFQTYVSTHQLAHYDSGTIGWIFSLYTFLAFFMGIYAGPVFDKYGPRYLVMGGTVCLAVSLMLLSICTRKFRLLPALVLITSP